MNRFTQSINRRRTARYKVWPAPSVRLRRIGIVSADPCIKILPILAKTACRGSGIFEFNSRYGSENIRSNRIFQGQIGWLSSYGITSNVENSALYWGKPNAGTTRTQQISGESSLDVYLDASRNNPLFGASETVQPAGLFAQCLIRYA